MSGSAKTKSFYFINKSASSTNLSRSTKSENSEIQNHVQTGRKRCRLRKQARKAVCIEAETGSSGLNIGSENNFSDLRFDQIDDSSSVTEASRWLVPHPTSRDILCKADPFNASSVHINRHVASLLHYYMYYYHPSQWPNEMVVLRHGIFVFEDAVLYVLKNAISDPLTMLCLLAASASRLQFVDRLPSRSIAGLETYYIDRAVQLMNRSINTSVLEDAERFKQLLTCVLFLNAAESYRENLSAATVHMQVTARLIAAKGGLQNLSDDTLRNQLAMSDLFLACVDVRPCSFACAYDPGPASTLGLSEDEIDLSIKSSPASSLLEPLSFFITSKLKSLIEAVAETHLVKTRVLTSGMSSNRALTVMHWITLRNMAIRNKLLALQNLDPRAHAIRISIIMWTLLAMNVTGRAKTIKLMAPKLMKVISTISVSSWEDWPRIRLWIVMMGFFCAVEKSDASFWFAHEVCRSWHQTTGHDPENASTKELTAEAEAFQRTFFYDESIQTTRTLRLAQILHETMAYSSSGHFSDHEVYT